ncbi:MAG: hypothetical protein PHI31_09930 [Desulfuromonadaceae bacterium]|nr:hypothetical protein [Desulfuromonadaceae bacterium]
MTTNIDGKNTTGLSKDDMLAIMEEHIRCPEIDAAIDEALARIAARRGQMIRNWWNRLEWTIQM